MYDPYIVVVDMQLVMQIGAALLLCLIFGGMFVAGWAADIFEKIRRIK